MRAPKFWSNPSPDWRARLLSPIGRLYAAGTARRLAQGHRQKLDVPVICVGNINAGGTGKTPTTIDIAQRLVNAYHQPHIVSRGYGGSQTGPLEVDPTRHTAQQVGDEPLLLSAFARTWVSKDRVMGAQAAIAHGATCILLDDGFQNPGLAHDLSVVVVDAHTGFGNGLCLPAGPLREPAGIGLKRADMVLSIGAADAQHRFGLTNLAPHLSHIRGELKPLQTGMIWKDMRLIAFAGIGRPEKFFDTLRQLGATLVRTEALRDHERLSPAFLSRLERAAKTERAQLVTTEKDAARLPGAFKTKVITLPVRLHLDDPEPLDTALSSLFF